MATRYSTGKFFAGNYFPVRQGRNKKIKIIAGLLLFFSSSSFLFGQFTKYNTGNSPLPDNNVQSLAIDRYGRKWIGTDNGLAVYNDTNWVIYNTSNSGLPNNSVRAIGFDKNGTAWIGTFFGGLAKFNGSTWTVYNTSNSGLPSNYVRTIDFDSLNNVWMGTDFGFAKFNSSTWTLWNTTNSTFVSDNISAIRINRKTDYKYIGTVNGGYTELNPANSITHYYISNSNLIDNTTWAIALDSSGYQWLGFPADGSMLHFTGNVWQWYATSNCGIPSNTVYDVFVDSLNKKYFATLAGLACFNGSTWTVWDTVNSNIPDNFVRKVLKDRNGIIWIGTVNGLAKMTGPLGLDEPAKDRDLISVFPNPNDGDFTAMVNDEGKDQCEILISDITGRVVYQSKENSKILRVHLDITPGVYFLKVKVLQKVYVSKIIVQRQL